MLNPRRDASHGAKATHARAVSPAPSGPARLISSADEVTAAMLIRSRLIVTAAAASYFRRVRTMRLLGAAAAGLSKPESNSLSAASDQV